MNHKKKKTLCRTKALYSVQYHAVTFALVGGSTGADWSRQLPCLLCAAESRGGTTSKHQLGGRGGGGGDKKGGRRSSRVCCCAELRRKRRPA